jgi:Ni,Fe-hydrogenase III small subunit
MTDVTDMTDAQQPARRASHTPVAVFAVDSGGCGACAQSVLALQATRYAKEMHDARISFAQTPRHADILLISGPLNAAARESIGNVIKATPQQRALIAVGDCAIDGGVFAESSTFDGNTATVFDVHVEIEGCPPAPLAILEAIGAARELLVEAEEEGVIEDADAGIDETESATDGEAQDTASEAIKQTGESGEDAKS